MLTHPDHIKITAKQIRLNMLTGSVEEEKKETVDDSIQNSEIQFGKYHYKRIDNGVVDQEFTVPVVVKSLKDLEITMNQLKRQILDGEIQITIEKIVTYIDDVPPPTQEELQSAISNCDAFEAIQIDVPEPQIPPSPSWD